uniref:Putative ovule protein n=1 Tax=Solanum chacoense TaxID=4108 RepID=A0A0V0GK42_SOLCH
MKYLSFIKVEVYLYLLLVLTRLLPSCFLTSMLLFVQYGWFFGTQRKRKKERKKLPLDCYQ